MKMPKAILELEMPESCAECPCKGTDAWGMVRCRLIHMKSDKYSGMAGGYAYKRRPDCPLKLVEDKEVETLRKAREAIQRAKENFEPYGEYEYDVRYDLEEALAEIDKAIGGKEDVTSMGD